MKTFSVSFYLRKDKTNKKSEAPVYMRVTVDGERAEISTNRNFNINKWRNGKPVGTTAEAKELNMLLESLRVKVYQIQRELIDHNENITAAKIKHIYSGNGNNKRTLVTTFEKHNRKARELAGIDFSPATCQRYETTLKHLQHFMQLYYKKDDIYLVDLSYSFITDFEHYLKKERNCGHNTSVKYVRNFKKIINLAVKNDWLQKDPFANYKGRLNEIEIECLDAKELEDIEKKEFSTKRMDTVRDIFVFCCYTGLAYADVARLSKENLVKGVDGDDWIIIHRKKTNSKSTIPLLPKASEILEKYKDEIKQNNNSDLLLPVISNQKTNEYLKEMAALCGIDRRVTFHHARHTFATTVTLEKGVSRESVQEMLGHKESRMTLRYSRVKEAKISKEMRHLKEGL